MRRLKNCCDLETYRERFMSFVLKTESCWIWQGTQTNNRGAIYIGSRGCCRRNHLAHRLAWKLFVDPELASTKQLNHACENSICVNPSHLYLGTQKENVWDCIRSENFGDRRGRLSGRSARLTDSSVLEIRRKYETGSYSQLGLAREFNVSQPTVFRVVNNLSWNYSG